jgi:hypothetical protein
MMYNLFGEAGTLPAVLWPFNFHDISLYYYSSSYLACHYGLVFFVSETWLQTLLRSSYSCLVPLFLMSSLCSAVHSLMENETSVIFLTVAWTMIKRSSQSCIPSAIASECLFVDLFSFWKESCGYDYSKVFLDFFLVNYLISINSRNNLILLISSSFTI